MRNPSLPRVNLWSGFVAHLNSFSPLATGEFIPHRPHSGQPIIISFVMGIYSAGLGNRHSLVAFPNVDKLYKDMQRLLRAALDCYLIIAHKKAYPVGLIV